MSAPESAPALTVTFGRGGNSDAFVREGWFGAEPRHRWTSGARSVLVLPPLAQSGGFTLTLDCLPLQIAGVTQTLAVELNGQPLGGVQAEGFPLKLAAPGERISDAGDNVLVFHHPHALRPAEVSADNSDTRQLAFMWRSLSIAPNPSAQPLDSILVDFRAGGNSDSFVREGWHREEPSLRWSGAERSVLVLPPLAPSPRFALTLQCIPFQIAGFEQGLALEWNGAALGGLWKPQPGVPMRLELPGERVSAASENILTLHASHALAPAEQGTGADRRRLAYGWESLAVEPVDAPPVEPRLLPEADIAALSAPEVAALYQSLGANCELGVFQRRCGIEPQGLLRFAFIAAHLLVRGLRTRFAGIGDEEALSFHAAPGGQLFGRHAAYGLDYHTFKTPSEVNLEDFQAKEARRLGFLARLFFEQLENDEKIFVRHGGFDAQGETLALHGLLTSFNPQARLLIVQAAPASEPWRAGRAERLSPNLYRGYLSKHADYERVVGTLPFEDWLRVCGAVYLDQTRPLGVEP